MTLTTGTDISVVLSGGSDNLSPDLSIGGEASATPITDNQLNNLFDDVTSEQNLDGIEDYRCVYYFNDGDSTVYSIKMFILEDLAGGATLETGIASQNESQRLLIVGLPTGGSITISYDGNDITLNYDSDLATMALSLQSSLNALVDNDNDPILEDVVVTAQAVGTSIIFDMLFAGQDGKREHPEIVVVSNDFTPSVTTGVTTIQSGSPINTTAPEIGTSTTPPGGVGFFASSLDAPIELPQLRPGDGLPMWIKRVVPANTIAKANDGLTLRFQAESLRE